ncbi:MAG: type II toxin-antitoxin system mRNA interferase toxin, RelE/StbE family [Selenomonadaceae bacterium]|nr:type II toxin-antitoxin system mRNA interferase toxin, RelE/StbE family [Selenomonadaceae bacterium]
MKKYSIDYDPHVIKKLNKLDAPVRNRIIKWIDKNLVGCENPRRIGKALQGGWEGHWRYRVGRLAVSL